MYQINDQIRSSLIKFIKKPFGIYLIWSNTRRMIPTFEIDLAGPMLNIRQRPLQFSIFIHYRVMFFFPFLKKAIIFFSFIDIVDCCFYKNVKNKYKKKNIRKWWRPNLASLLMLIIVESDFKMLYYWRRKTILYNSVWKYFTRS